MGYAGKVEERHRARELRAEAWTLQEIAAELGVAKSTVSLWVRDVPFTPKPRNRGARRHRPHPLHLARLAEVEACDELGRQRLGQLSDHAFLAAGAALYAGEGAKTDGALAFANSDPRMVALFLRWLRTFFDIDESRLRMRLYLHVGLDLEAATAHWVGVTGVPPEQFRRPYRAVADGGIRHTKHENGCATVSYSCSRTHREVMGLVRALLA
jgi:transcriptional regulator with XRE-family HTH domain